MDSRFLEHYNQELRFIREMGVEFAERYPKIAGRLDLGSTGCADPYVERLLEGFAFLTARVQLKLEAEFPRFTQHLLEMVYPHCLAPIPAMTIAQFEPDLNGGVTEDGFLLPRHTELFASLAIKGHVNCKFRTAHDVMLWPISIANVDYLTRGEATAYSNRQSRKVRSAIRLRLETVVDIKFQDLKLDKLALFLKGGGELPAQAYELIIGHAQAVVVQPPGSSPAWCQELPRRSLKALGFDDEQALLPYGHQSFQGYRLLQEYFCLPQRFLFFELNNLLSAVKRSEDTALEIVILLDKEQDELEGLLDRDNFALNCTPAINLFPKRADRIRLSHRSTDHQLIVDRTRPRDYEVYALNKVTGYGSSSAVEQEFHPFYSVEDGMLGGESAYFTIERRPTLESVKNTISGKVTPYLGNEVFISLVDAEEAPYNGDLKQLGVDVLCTNRGLSQFLLSGQAVPEFNLEVGAPVNGVRSLTGFTDPRAGAPVGEYAWRLISHLSLNYLSILGEDQDAAARALRELLSLYGDFSEPGIRKQIEGLHGLESKQIVRRIPVDGPMAFGRGVEISILFDESAFQGAGAFLLGAVLERFFSKYVSINSFTQTRVNTLERGGIMVWPVRTGTRTLI